MLIVSYTQIEKATILIEAVRNKIELTPSMFAQFLEILSEVTCAKEVVESLRFTYQSEWISLVYMLRADCVTLDINSLMHTPHP